MTNTKSISWIIKQRYQYIIESKEILIWKHIESEVAKGHKYLKEELIELGYTIQSAILDGKRGFYKALKYSYTYVQLLSKEDNTKIHQNGTKIRSK